MRRSLWLLRSARSLSASSKRSRSVRHTNDWEELLPLFLWPEKKCYETIRPLVLFGDPVSERSERTGVSERTLYRRTKRFEAEGMESLFAADPAKHRRLPPALLRLIVVRKAEYPAFSLGEIARICYVAFGRRPSRHTVKRVIEESPTPLMPVRRYLPYHETSEGRKRREAGLSRATCGRIMAENRRVYGLETPRGGGGSFRRRCPSPPRGATGIGAPTSATWTFGGCPPSGSRVYVISVLENHSRAVLSSGVFSTQDLSSFLSVFYQAVERYGSPEVLVTESGFVFRANRAMAIY